MDTKKGKALRMIEMEIQIKIESGIEIEIGIRIGRALRFLY